MNELNKPGTVPYGTVTKNYFGKKTVFYTCKITFGTRSLHEQISTHGRLNKTGFLGTYCTELVYETPTKRVRQTETNTPYFTNTVNKCCRSGSVGSVPVIHRPPGSRPLMLIKDSKKFKRKVTIFYFNNLLPFRQHIFFKWTPNFIQVGSGSGRACN